MVRAAHFKRARKVARSDLALTIAMPPKHEETEYALPIERAAEALRELRALIDREKLRVNFVDELRRKLDPHGMFENDFLARVFAAPGS